MTGRSGQSFVFETTRLAEEKPALFAGLRTFAREQDWLPSITNEIDLILEEWFTDVISYGVINSNIPYLKIEIHCSGDLATITVTDSGIPFDPTDLPSPDLGVPTEERPIGGLGIFMIRKLSSGLRYQRRDQQNVLTIEKNLAKPILIKN